MAFQRRVGRRGRTVRPSEFIGLVMRRVAIGERTVPTRELNAGGGWKRVPRAAGWLKNLHARGWPIERWSRPALSQSARRRESDELQRR
jgi:hypothetical protein